ncbi:MAG: cupredoxin protein [Acidimicrobiales bacterium]|nr:cupredoxin protein [Acidimicrobiales bacterium]
MRARRLTTGGLIVLTAGLVFAGCGSSDKKSSSSATTEATTAASTGTTTQAPPQQSGALSVVTQDFMFVPASLDAKVGQAVTVTIKNEGKAEHNFSITSLNVNKDLAPGKTETVTFTPKTAGDLQYFCEYHKASKNMVGTLTVGM